MFSKTCTFLYFYILPHLFIFWNPFSPHPSSPPFFYFPTPVSTNLIRNIKPSLINELSLIVLFSAVNIVLITTPSFSMQFFSFFDLLPSAPTITGMISLFNFWYLSIVYFSFSLTLMSPVIGISIMAQPLSFLFTTTICGFRALISLSHWIITSHKIFSSAFQRHLLEHVHTIFTAFQVVFLTQFPMNYSCNIIMPSLALLLCKCFTFAHNIRYCFTFLVTHILQTGDWVILSVSCLT